MNLREIHSLGLGICRRCLSVDSQRPVQTDRFCGNSSPLSIPAVLDWGSLRLMLPLLMANYRSPALGP